MPDMLGVCNECTQKMKKSATRKSSSIIHVWHRVNIFSTGMSINRSTVLHIHTCTWPYICGTPGYSGRDIKLYFNVVYMWLIRILHVHLKLTFFFLSWEKTARASVGNIST